MVLWSFVAILHSMLSLFPCVRHLSIFPRPPTAQSLPNSRLGHIAQVVLDLVEHILITFNTSISRR